VRVATLNLWGRSGDWAARRTALTAGLRALAPDLMAFQEAEDQDHVADLLGPGYEVVHRGFVAIASRSPIRAVHELQGETRAAATLMAEIGDIVLVNHFPSWAPSQESERERETVAAARLIEELVGDRHVIVGGDLDAVPDASSIRFWRGRQGLDGFSVKYWDAWETVHPGDPGHTFTPRNPLVMEETQVTREEARRIDYLFVRCTDDGPTLDIEDCRLIFDQPIDDTWASDHFGLAAELAPFDQVFA
jgi:endonuclease/exonuclease/phosphatase family metal-dependent hydrolase